MSVSAVQNYDNGNPLARVINGTLIGGVIGYGAKNAIGLQKAEKKDIDYRSIVNSSRKSVNQNKLYSFKILKDQILNTLSKQSLRRFPKIQI